MIYGWSGEVGGKAVGIGQCEGIVNLLSLSGVMGMVGVGRAGSHDPFQATVAVAVPVIWFQMMNRSVIVRRYSAAESR